MEKSQRKDSMQLSIVVPVYNMAAGNKLKFCLDSLINQTIGNYEIIAVDDASTDNSFRILQEYEARYPGKLKALHSSKNLKQGGAKNIGIDAALGEWIGFIDSDDWIAPDMYEKLIGKALATGADVVGCDYSLVDKQTMDVGKIITNNTADQTGILDDEKYGKLIMNPGSMVIKVYRKSVIDDNHLRFPEKSFYEDNCAAPIWLLHFKHFERVEEPLYYYYQHDMSTVHEISQAKCEDRLAMGQKMIDEAREYGFLERYHKEFEFSFAKLYYMNTLFSYMLGVKKTKLSFLKIMSQGIIK
jgi:glycosyltransferase involved in cell wall biosynthesis